MGKLLVVLLGFGVLFGAAYVYLSKGAPTQTQQRDAAPSAPAQRLQQTRDTAKRIEADSQRRADELLERTE